MSNIKKEIINKYEAAGNNVLLIKTEKSKKSGPVILDNGLVSISNNNNVTNKPEIYEIISIGSLVKDISNLKKVLLQPAARGGIIVDSITNNDITYSIINITINDILAFVK